MAALPSVSISRCRLGHPLAALGRTKSCGNRLIFAHRQKCIPDRPLRQGYEPPGLRAAHARTRTSFGLDWNIFDVVHEFAREAVGLSAVEGPVFLAGNVGLVGIAKPGG